MNFKPLLSTAYTALFVIGASAIAWAHDDKAPELPESAMAAQRTALGVIGLAILAGIVFYFVRRWQTLHSGNIVSGTTRDDG